MIGVALAGRYEILYELGHGGMAIVYAATDRPTSGLIAVKVMRPELAVALGAKRFTREVRVTAKLRHPGIVPLLDAGVAEGLPFCGRRHNRSTERPLLARLRAVQNVVVPQNARGVIPS